METCPRCGAQGIDYVRDTTQTESAQKSDREALIVGGLGVLALVGAFFTFGLTLVLFAVIFIVWMVRKSAAQKQLMQANGQTVQRHCRSCNFDWYLGDRPTLDQYFKARSRTEVN